MCLAAGGPPVTVKHRAMNWSIRVRTSLYKIGIGVLNFRTKLFSRQSNVVLKCSKDTADTIMLHWPLKTSSVSYI